VSVIGFLGVGHIAADLVEGLTRAGRPPRTLLLSPRGRDTAAALHRRHAVPIAPDNAAVVAGSDIVVLCVRPAAALVALQGLPWRSGQLLLSVVAGVPRAELAKAAAPADVVRAMPISAARLGRSPTTLYPDESRAHALLAALGPVLPVAEEAAFERATISAAMYGWVHALIGESAGWLGEAGLDPAQARALAAGTFAAAAAMVASTETPVEAMLAALATPGGITEAGLRSLRADGVPQAWQAAFDAALARVLTATQSRFV